MNAFIHCKQGIDPILLSCQILQKITNVTSTKSWYPIGECRSFAPSTEIGRVKSRQLRKQEG
jgi:hypothetical protein